MCILQHYNGRHASSILAVSDQWLLYTGHFVQLRLMSHLYDFPQQYIAHLQITSDGAF